jgi:hypothetical protein
MSSRAQRGILPGLTAYPPLHPPLSSARAHTRPHRLELFGRRPHPRSDPAPPAGALPRSRHARRHRRGDPEPPGARRTAHRDRGGDGNRHRRRAAGQGAGGAEGRRHSRGVRGARRHPTDGGESALGPRPDAAPRGGRVGRWRGPGGGHARGGPGDLGRGSRHVPADRRAGRGAGARRRHRVHHLQCRGTRHRGDRHRAGADLSAPGAGPRAARPGARDPPTAAGQPAHRLGVTAPALPAPSSATG